MVEGVVANRPATEQRTIERIAALLLTMTGWQRNYTATLDAAAWMLDEARRIGWDLMVEGRSS